MNIAPASLQDTLTLILAGGQGERLFPLTKDRSKPSVPFAGSYRIIDFTLSNCINSGLRHIFVLTQYKSQSLNRHIRDGWSLLSSELREFIETVPPQKRTHSRWYEGTSDAVYQNVFLLEQRKPARTLILSGDHIYRMDYRELLEFHMRKQAEVTIASFVFPSEKARPFGVMQVDDQGRVLDFVEKPEHPPEIPGRPGCSLINMGVYVFNTPRLVRSVIDDHKIIDSQFDLGKNVLPLLVREGEAAVYAFPFGRDGSSNYWRDVGGLSSYYSASMDLLDEDVSINLFSRDWPFRSASQQWPPCRLNINPDSESRICCSLVSGGCRIEGNLNHCIISPGVAVGENSTLDGCIVFNEASIGRNCHIRKTIIDKNVVIPDGCVIGGDPERDGRQFLIADDRLVVIPKGMMVEKQS
ncbi:MAG: glucose-1-phosphate adenylyltransferase [Candidatus Omnitrophica bacterium]|nr:glucose-1-phosphate adenylyltransferase [Candidatus Omnitrophota bacterium]